LPLKTGFHRVSAQPRNSGTGSRILTATLRYFSLFADRTATPRGRRSKRAIRCFSNMALCEEYHLSANVLCNLHMQLLPQPCHHMGSACKTPALGKALGHHYAEKGRSRQMEGSRLLPLDPDSNRANHCGLRQEKFLQRWSAGPCFPAAKMVTDWVLGLRSNAGLVWLVLSSWLEGSFLQFH
jgi:hypothetical protein